MEKELLCLTLPQLTSRAENGSQNGHSSEPASCLFHVRVVYSSLCWSLNSLSKSEVWPRPLSIPSTLHGTKTNSQAPQSFMTWLFLSIWLYSALNQIQIKWSPRSIRAYNTRFSCHLPGCLYLGCQSLFSTKALFHIQFVGLIPGKPFTLRWLE